MEEAERECGVDWDMRRVLMTQMGLVATVLLAPAMMEDQKFTTKELAGSLVSFIRGPERGGGNGRQKPTMILPQHFLRLIIHREPDRPGGQIPHNNGPQPPIHPPEALFPPDDASSSKQALVDPRLVGTARAEPPLRLQLRLDDV